MPQTLDSPPRHTDIALLVEHPLQSGWRPHAVTRMGEPHPHAMPAQFQLINASWGRHNVQMPSMIYLPQKRRLLMTAEFGPPPVRTISIFSDDDGATWSERQWLQTSGGKELQARMSVGLTDLGDGKITLSSEDGPRWFSFDDGQTWPQTLTVPLSGDGKPLYHWDPLLIDRDEQGNILRLLESRWKTTGRAWDAGQGPYSQACTWFSVDEGKTWSAESIIPQWRGVNEVAFIRAPNGNIVAACRTDNPQRFIGQLDLYSGLGVSISRDNGRTWSDLNMLYEFGRHHPSLILLPDGRIVMSYAVRRGYQDAPNGFPQFGIEAIMSCDNGQTWDLNHRYVLASWQGNIIGENAWWGLSQSTTTVLLPDGSLLTAFGTGVRNRPNQEKCIMDIGLVKWRIDAREERQR